VPIGIASRHTANAILRQAGLPKAFCARRSRKPFRPKGLLAAVRAAMGVAA
jgi:hypothetical protein